MWTLALRSGDDVIAFNGANKIDVSRIDGWDIPRLHDTVGLHGNVLDWGPEEWRRFVARIARLPNITRVELHCDAPLIVACVVLRNIPKLRTLIIEREPMRDDERALATFVDDVASHPSLAQLR